MKRCDITLAAQLLGRLGGLSRSANKVAASRANGSKGGRPRKVASVLRGGAK